MKIKVNLPIFKKMIDAANGVVPRKSPKPIITSVLLKADSQAEALTVHATDEEMAYENSMPCHVEAPGAIALNAKELHDACRVLSGDILEIELINPDSLEIQLKAGKSTLIHMGVDAIEYPVLDFPKSKENSTFPKALIQNAIQSTLFATSTEETRYYLGGIYVEKKANEDLRFTATDGHRLATCYLDSPPKYTISDGCIVPRKFVGELSKMLDKFDGDTVEIQLLAGSESTRKVFAIAGDLKVSSLLINGSFPDYTQVMLNPNKHDLASVIVSKSEFLTSLKVASLSNSGGARIQFTADQSTMLVSTGTGKITETQVALWGKAGRSFEVGLNVQYLTDAIACVDTPYLKFTFHHHLSPIQIEPIDLVEHEESKMEQSVTATQGDGDDTEDTDPKEPKERSTPKIKNPIFIVMPMRL